MPPPIQPLTTKTWDSSISMLPAEDGGPLIIYDAQDGKLGTASGLGDSPILGVARLSNPNDKYLTSWVRDPRKNLISVFAKIHGQAERSRCCGILLLYSTAGARWPVVRNNGLARPSPPAATLGGNAEHHR